MIQIIKALGFASVMRSRYIKKAQNPVVFVPGLYGSMGDVIIPGTGDWGFGISSSVYEPFIKQLEELGFVLNDNLFIAYFDWRKDCKYCMEEYLKPVIDFAKKKTRSRKIDIVCHSMGGLVTRSYLQSKSYKNDVEKVIFIATPHAGAANTYSFWTEGKLLSKNDIESQLFTMIVEGYLWILTRLHGYSNEIEAIHNLLPGALNLMPNKNYGEYLYYFDVDNNIHFIPYEDMDFTNSFLDELNNSKKLLESRKLDITLIVGKGVSTNNRFQVKSHEKDMGKIISVNKSNEGDGTVTLNSATAIEGETYILHASHTGILKKSFFVVKEKLGIPEKNSIEDQNIVDSKEEKHISILINCNGKLKVYQKTKEVTRLLYDGTFKDKNVFVEEYDDKLKWLIIHDIDEDQLILDYEATEEDSMDIQINTGTGKKVFHETNPIKGNAYRMKIH